MTRPLLLALAAALALAACDVASQNRAEITDRDAVPFELLDADAPPVLPTTAAAPREAVSLCYLADGRLAVSQSELRAEPTLLELVRALATTPRTPPALLRTALFDPSVVLDVRAAGGIARVDLSRSIATLGGQEQLLAVAQIVCTLTNRPGIGLVSFTLEGTPVDVPRGDGSLVAQPVSRDDYAALLP